MKLLRWSVPVFIALAFTASHAHAAGIDPAQFGDQGWFTTRIASALTTLQANITSALGSGYDVRSSSTYTSWAFGLMMGAWAFKFVEVAARTAVFGDPYSDLVGVIVTGGIAQILFASYGGWTWDLINAGTYLGQLVQAKALGSDALMYPYIYIVKAWAMFQLSPVGIMSLNIDYFLDAAVLVVFSFLLFAAGLFACMWPTLVGGIAVLLGPLTLMFVFHKSVSWIFDGWLRLMFWTAIFAFVSRVSLVIICLVFGSAFGYGSMSMPGGNPVLLTPDNPLAFVFLVAMAIVSLALLFFSGVVTSMITGGSNIDAAGMVKGAAQQAGRALVSLI
ncbi:hypothetical protein AD951_08330 [Acetobacter malorum]|uniref:Type IV secretion system protein VirB6 n=1 Tax=Acetobacter malorum TaxID=178901 RepID=A0A149UM76_9PROT|nr:hypothetical protein [Acetobacter malorum]KXV69037.1 hypothetical protein AD951_08330 [Acetobacter malorum]